MAIKELQARLTQTKADMQKIIDAAEASGGLMTEEQQASFNSLKTVAENTKATIDAQLELNAVSDYQDSLKQSSGRKTSSMDFTGGGYALEKDPKMGFSDLAEFSMSVRKYYDKNSGYKDDRISAMQQIFAAPSNYHKESGSDDGLMVPPAFREGIWEAVESVDNSLLSMVDYEPTASNSVQLLRDESTPWGTTGVKAYWANEASQFSATRLVTAPSVLQLHKLFAFTTATDELLTDAPRLADRLNRRAAQAINWTASKSIPYGTGVGQPLGFFNSSALVSVAKETSQTADTVNANNIAKMYARMLPESIQNAVWLVNSDVLPQLLTMTLGDNAIYTLPQNGFTKAPGGFLLGRPVIFSDHCKTVGDQGDIMFVDMKGYYSPRKTGTKFDRSIHLYFDYDVEAFRWTFRIGGAPYLSSAITPANGSSTKSHFVVLDARA